MPTGTMIETAPVVGTVCRFSGKAHCEKFAEWVLDDPPMKLALAMLLVKELRAEVFSGPNWCTFLDLEMSRANLKVVEGVKVFFNGMVRQWLSAVRSEHGASCCKLGEGLSQALLDSIDKAQITVSPYHVTKERKRRHDEMDRLMQHPITKAPGTELFLEGAENRGQMNFDMVLHIIINNVFPWLVNHPTSRDKRCVRRRVRTAARCEAPWHDAVAR